MFQQRSLSKVQPQIPAKDALGKEKSRGLIHRDARVVHGWGQDREEKGSIMGKKENCWEFFQCGREPGGKMVDQLGICPAAIDEKLDGINDGKAGGRACWTVEDTLCAGTIGRKYLKCINCNFFNVVSDQQKRSFVPGLEKDSKKE